MQLVAMPRWFWAIVCVTGVFLVQVKTAFDFALGLTVMFPLFILALSLQMRPGFGVAVWKALGMLSMGIYLVHPLFTALGHMIIKHFYLTPGVAVVLADWIASWLFSLAAAALLSRFPPIRRVVT